MSGVTQSNCGCEPQNAIRFQLIGELRISSGDVKYHLGIV